MAKAIVKERVRLNEKERLFCEQYVIDFNGRQAVLRTTGYTDDGPAAGVKAFRLLRRKRVLEYIDKLLFEIEQQLQINRGWLVKELLANHEKAHETSEKECEKCGEIMEGVTPGRDLTASTAALNSIAKVMGYNQDPEKSGETTINVQVNNY